MTEEKKDERAAEEARLESKAMTGEIDPTKNERLTAEEEEVRLKSEERERSIGRALRHAAGYLYQDDPFVKRSDDDGLPGVREFVDDIHYKTALYMGHNPRALAKELDAVRIDIKRLKNRIASLGDDARLLIMLADSPEGEALATAVESGDIDRKISAHRAFYAAPNELRAIPAVLSAIDRLDAVLIQMIEKSIEASARLPKKGPIPKYRARDVAYLVAQYVVLETSFLPGLWTGENPSGPFAHALLEIFEILGIDADIQRAGEWAIETLRSDWELEE